jgi:hypothetical protein
MMRLFSVFIILFLALGCGSDHKSKDGPSPYADLLNQLKSAGFKVDGGVRDSELGHHILMTFEQPVDHFSDAGWEFNQFLVMQFRGELDQEKPVLLVTEGYEGYAYPPLEHTEDVIQINVEHRFFGSSVPSDSDYKFLNARQAAADHHAIRLALKSIFTGPWIATGVSKGGMAALLYRYFYPEDVRGTLAHVAPLFASNSDDRALAFVQSHVPAPCIESTKVLQIEMLKRRQGLLPLMQKEIGPSQDPAFVTMRFETVVVDFFHNSMQRFMAAENPNCSIAGSNELSDEDFYKTHIKPRVSSYSDHYPPFIYQAQTELGAFSMPRDHLEGLLTTKYDDMSLLIPKALPVTFDGSTIAGVRSWLQTDARDVMLIYGDRDIFTAARGEPGTNEGVKVFVMPKGTHGSARLKRLDPVVDQAAFDLFESWTQ